MTIKNCKFNHTALLAGLLALAACNSGQGPDPSPDGAGDANQSMLGNAVDSAMDKARADMRTSNISLSGGAGGMPKAELTPNGVLLIDGREVTTTPEQEAMLIDYRTRLMDVADSGMDIGAQGANLAGKAMGAAAKGIFTGQSEAEIEQAMEAEAEQIKAAADKLCDRMPALLASEQRLAASLPEFAPYASMSDGDIDDCRDGPDPRKRMDGGGHDGAARADPQTM